MIRLEETTLINAPIQRCFDLSRSVEVHLLSNIHSGEQALAVGGITSGLVGLSEQVTWRAKCFGVWHDLTSRTTALESPFYFQVTMVRGIFRFMQAEHLFQTLPSGATEMKDIFSIAAPLPLLGPLAEALFSATLHACLVARTQCCHQAGCGVLRVEKVPPEPFCSNEMTLRYEDRDCWRHRTGGKHLGSALPRERTCCCRPQPELA
jgi:hypothetical protein